MNVTANTGCVDDTIVLNVDVISDMDRKKGKSDKGLKQFKENSYQKLSSLWYLPGLEFLVRRSYDNPLANNAVPSYFHGSEISTYNAVLKHNCPALEDYVLTATHDAVLAYLVAAWSLNELRFLVDYFGNLHAFQQLKIA